MYSLGLWAIPPLCPGKEGPKGTILGITFAYVPPVVVTGAPSKCVTSSYTLCKVFTNKECLSN